MAAMVSPSGPRLAGKHGASLLSLSMSVAEGFAAIGQAWGVVEEQAAKAGAPAPDRRTWRVLGTMHLAETSEQAIEDCTYGLKDFANYFGGGAGFVPLANDGRRRAAARRASSSRPTPSRGSVVIGTPDDAIEYIEGLLEQSGGFGTFLMLGHDWADPEAHARTRYRLFAREVIPHFQGQLAAPTRVARLGDGQAGRALRPGRPGDAERHHHPRRGEGGRANGAAARGSRLMRAAVALRDGEIVVRDDVPEPEPGVRPGARAGEGVRHLRVRPALRQARRRRCSALGERDGGHARRSAPGRASTSTATSSWATSSPPRCSRSAPTPSAPAAGHDRHVDPDPADDDRRRADRLQRTTLPAGYGERMLLSAPLLLEVPNGLDPRHAALTEPMAVGLHAVNRSRHQAGRGRARARLRAGRPRPSSPR